MKFIKMEALGNDYIYVDMEDNVGLKPEDIRKLAPKICPRHTGVGGDGVIVLYRLDGKIETRIFNPDSSEAENCGNGLRCVARIAFDRGWTKGKKDFEIILGKAKKHVHAYIKDDAVSINMGKAKSMNPEVLLHKESEINFIPVDMANPHAVVFVSDLNSIKVEEIGPIIENDKRFPLRTNVEFVEVQSKNKIKLRVWERGVGETLACGSGACASAYAAFSSGFCAQEVEVEMPGGTAFVSVKEDGAILLTGPVKYVFKGELIS